MRDPRVGFVTVTAVLVTNDLSHARVMVSVPGEEADKTRALEGLQSAAGFLRSRAARALTTRSCPSCTSSSTEGSSTPPGSASCSNDIRREEPGLIGAVLVDKPAGHDLARRGAAGAARARAPARPGTPERSIPSPPDCWWCWWAGPPGWRGSWSAGQDVSRHRAARRPHRHRRPHRPRRRDQRRGASGDPRAGCVEALAGFVGEQPQRPPQYSAKHVGGERSYRMARRGEAVELPPVDVTVHRIELLECRPPEVTFRAAVSAGTYLRAIARDLGERLGVGAHLTALRREAIGSLRVEEAVPLDQLSRGALISASQVLGHLPAVELDPRRPDAVVHGRAVVDSGAAGKRGSGAVVALLGDGELVAVARGGGRLASTDGGAGDAVSDEPPRLPAAPLPRLPNGTTVTVGLVRRRAPRASGGAAGDRPAGARRPGGPACW